MVNELSRARSGQGGVMRVDYGVAASWGLLKMFSN